MIFITKNYTEHDITLSAETLKNIKSNDLTEDMLNHLINWDVSFADKVILAYDNNNLAGFLRYDLGNDPKNIYDAGLYVQPEYRKIGIGFSLWENIIKIYNPNNIFAHITSINGFNLVEKLKNKYKSINFDLTFEEKIRIYKEYKLKFNIDILNI